VSHKKAKQLILQNQAATSFQIAIQGNRNPSYVDLAAGAGGAYRYLMRMFNAQSRTRIEKVGLLRGTVKQGPLYSKRRNYGWDDCTSDINAGRKGDYLYVCWKNVAV